MAESAPNDQEKALIDGQAWRKSEGIPSIEEPFLQKYLAGREALIAQEKRQRSDNVFREHLSPMAREASAIVARIRDDELSTVWRSEGRFPGMPFMQARETILQTDLWKIVKRMPKGALLHCHLDAMIEIDWLLDELFAKPGMHISAFAPLSDQNSLDRTPFTFKWRKESTQSTRSIWSDEYTADDFVPLKDAAESFPAGGVEGFRRWIMSRATITKEESVRHDHGLDAVWQKFLACFLTVGSMLNYEDIWQKSVKRVLKQLSEDGIRYVDFRAVFRAPFYRLGSETPEPDNSLKIELLEAAIDDFMDSPEGKNFWGARLIWTEIRRLNTEMLIDGMKEAIRLKQRHPDLIAGFDMVAQEDMGRPLSDLLPELFWFKKACAEAGVDLPFFFHAGETLDDGGEADQNLFDAILLGTRRIGHGYSLYKHPLLIDMVKQKKILIESCPISNEVLRLNHSVLSHTTPALLSRGVSVALCNDDPAMLGQVTSGMSFDFWQALQGWQNLGLEGLAHLAENSIRWSTFDDFNTAEWQQELKDGAFGQGERAQRMKEWAHEFEEFCAWIVKEFGS